MKLVYPTRKIVFKMSSLLLATSAAIALPLSAAALVQVDDSIVVNADMATVWQTLKDYQREQKLFDKKIVSEDENDTEIKEEFIKIPLVGSESLNYIESRKGNDRVDYWLTRSKILNVFKGAWQLSKNENGGTTIRLTTVIDSWMPVPMKDKILRNSTATGMKKRLAYVKSHAEELAQAKLASSQNN